VYSVLRSGDAVTENSTEAPSNISAHDADSAISESAESANEEGMRGRWRRIPVVIRWPIVAFAIWTLIVVAIQLAALDQAIEKMPRECPADSLNCVRVASDGTAHRADGLESPLINSSRQEVRREIWLWLEQERGGSHLRSTGESSPDGLYFHGVDRTDFWFFPDDLFAFTACAENGLTRLSLQSQSRLGAGDMGVNHARLAALIKHLETVVWSGNRCDANTDHPGMF
jgi:uncharacterized protein (DUF1499 family)